MKVNLINICKIEPPDLLFLVVFIISYCFYNSILRTIYFSILESHLNYWSLVWSQNCHAINRLVVLQKKALRIISFQQRHSHSSPLFKKSSILKFSDNVNLENTLFVSKSINNLLPSLFNNWFLFSSDQHNYETSWSSLDNLHKSSYKTNTYGKNSIVVSAINAWNNSQKLLKISLRHLSPNKIKKILSDAFFSKYWNELSAFRYIKLMLDDFQILQALYLFFPFLPVVVIL